MEAQEVVEVTVTLRLAVVDEAALLGAVEALDGPAGDEAERALRAVPANLIGRLVHAPLLTADIPGVQPCGSSVTVH